MHVFGLWQKVGELGENPAQTQGEHAPPQARGRYKTEPVTLDCTGQWTPTCAVQFGIT